MRPNDGRMIVIEREGYRDIDSLPEGIVDDYVYLDGESKKKPDWRLPYILVVGERGIGKSVYSKSMSEYHSGVQYISVQTLGGVHVTFRNHAEKIIILQEVTL